MRFDDRDLKARRYALVEWARTSELEGFFVFRSLLAEAMLHRGRVGVGYRFERTERPEEERLSDPFRSKRPHIENSIIGMTRWTLHTVRVEGELLDPDGKASIAPFAEATVGAIRKVGEGVFEVSDYYASDRVRQLSVGVSIGWGMRGHRMGRYGVHAAAH